jgi:hypothetical protein
MRCKTLGAKRREFISLGHRIPCDKVNLDHRLHESNPLRMIMGKPQQTSARLDVLKRNQNRL